MVTPFSSCLLNNYIIIALSSSSSRDEKAPEEQKLVHIKNNHGWWWDIATLGDDRVESPPPHLSSHIWLLLLFRLRSQPSTPCLFAHPPHLSSHIWFLLFRLRSQLSTPCLFAHSHSQTDSKNASGPESVSEGPGKMSQFSSKRARNCEATTCHMDMTTEGLGSDPESSLSLSMTTTQSESGRSQTDSSWGQIQICWIRRRAN